MTRTARGQPVLVGTRTVEMSRMLAKVFDGKGVPYQLLNGTQDADEADIVAGAGERGNVTIATNMAGRGTDIRLGPGVADCGGLHVVVSEPHESTRVDLQLIGRCARQADPGSFQRYVAADDALLRTHAPGLGDRMRRSAGRSGEIPGDYSRAIARAQRRAERLARSRRRQLMLHDDRLEQMLLQA